MGGADRVRVAPGRRCPADDAFRRGGHRRRFSGGRPPARPSDPASRGAAILAPDLVPGRFVGTDGSAGPWPGAARPADRAAYGAVFFTVPYDAGVGTIHRIGEHAGHHMAPHSLQ